MKTNNVLQLSTKILTLIFTIVAYSIVSSQNYSNTQFVYNPAAINPAIAGESEDISLYAFHRSQWIGVEGGPEDYIISGNMPFRKNMGLGLFIDHSNLAPLKETTIKGQYSYKIEVARNRFLSFGMELSINHKSFDFSDFPALDEGDDVIGDLESDNNIKLNLGTGLFYKSNNFFGGLSFLNLFSKENINNDFRQKNEKLTFDSYLFMGYIFNIGTFRSLNNSADSILIKPSFNLRYLRYNELNLDLNLNTLFYDKFILGVSHRIKSSIGAVTGFRFSEEILVGLHYEKSISNVDFTKNGSFEVFLKFNLGKYVDRVMLPRFF